MQRLYREGGVHRKDQRTQAQIRQGRALDARMVQLSNNLYD